MKRCIIGLAVVAVAATACSHSGSDERAFEWTNTLAAGTVVHLQNGVGDITVHRSDDSNARITADRSWRRGRSSDIKFVVTQRDNEYYVCAMWRNSGKCAANGYRGRNTGGFLAMFSLFHRTTDATADFSAELPSNVVIDIRTTSGDISVDGLTAGVTARTANGDVEAINVGGPITLASKNGDISLATAEGAAEGAISLTTSNGDVSAELPASAEGAFDLATSRGEVQSAFPLAPTSNASHGGHLRGQIGTATRNVKLRTSHGSIVLSRAGAVTNH